MTQHTPVLVKQVLEIFQPKPGDILLDATIGHGGHAKVYLDATSPEGKVVGVDADPKALEVARENLKEYESRVKFINANFHNVNDSILGGGIVQDSPLFNHILFDLGIGSHQIGDPSRGFSFQSEGRLTMKYGDSNLPPSKFKSLNRLEQRLGVTPDVQNIITNLSNEELHQIIFSLGEERLAGKVAAALKEEPLPTTGQELADRISSALPAGYERGRIHPATRTFQALRLAVNRELEVLEKALPQAVNLLAPEGVLAVISFHSLEDRVVKQYFKQIAKGCICPPDSPTCVCGQTSKAAILTKKPIVADQSEIVENPRSRSAKLRAISAKIT